MVAIALFLSGVSFLFIFVLDKALALRGFGRVALALLRVGQKLVTSMCSAG